MRFNKLRVRGSQNLRLTLHDPATYLSLVSSFIYTLVYIIVPIFIYNGDIFNPKSWITFFIDEFNPLQVIGLVVGTPVGLYFYYQSLCYIFKPYKIVIDNNGVILYLIFRKNYEFTWKQILLTQIISSSDDKYSILEITVLPYNIYKCGFRGDATTVSEKIDDFKSKHMN